MGRMPIELVTGPANAGKAEVVMEAVRRHLAHGREPLLVVPTHADVDHYRRELTGSGALMGASVVGFGGLIGEAARRAGVVAPALSGWARERLLWALAGGARTDGATPGYVGTLGALIGELQERRVTPARLSGALGRWEAAEGPVGVAGEVGDLFERYRRTVARIGCLDSEQLAARALDGLRRDPSLWRERPVLFYGFDDLTPMQLDAVETLGVGVGAEVTVSLPYEPGRTAFAGRAGTFQWLEPLAARHRPLEARADHYAPGARRALAHLERSLFEAGVGRAEPGSAVRLLEGGGERAELELVAGEIGGLLERGIAPGEIAVVLRAPPAALDLVEEVFSAAGIPYALQRRRSLSDTSIGRGLIGLLRSVPASGGRADAGRAGDLLAWLRSPGLLERPELADRLELRVRREGVPSAEGARQLWEQGSWRLEAIDRLGDAQERGPRALLARARRELWWLFGAPRRRGACVLEEEERDEGHALAAGVRALDELEALAEGDAGLAPGSAAELALALERVRFTSGSPPSPAAVAMLDPLALRARRVRALFVCRLQEGVFPAPAPPHPFLAEEERRALARTSGLRLDVSQDALAHERYLFYAAVSRPLELLVLSWHNASDDGSPAAPSLFVDDLCDLFEPGLRERRARRPPGAVGGTVSADPSEEPPAGLRDEELLAGLRAHTWSASSLGLWIRCPVRWLVERLLRAEDLDPDAEPLARGALAHLALKDTLEGLARRTGSARVTGQRLELARELLAGALAEHAAEHPLSRAPERLPGLERRLRADLERYLEHAAGLQSPLEPAHLELGFGFEKGDERGEESALPAFDLGEGVTLRGRIDRVDVGPDGEAVVYDYKGANVSPPARWIEEGDLQVALYMGAVESLLGLRAAGGFYQPLTGGDLRARGVLDGEGGVELPCVGGDVRDHEQVRDLLVRAAARAREAAAQAGRGELRPRPQSCGFRGGCAYPAICRCGR
jgi:ATP-dependent helicase/nuclease subunit B